jgi:hypothetical protein
MRILLVLVVIVGLGALVYAKVIRSSSEHRACEQLQTLCGGEVDMGECTKDMDEASKIVGPKVMDKATDCMAGATTCTEAAGCLVGAGTHAMDDFMRGFERGQK